MWEGVDEFNGRFVLVVKISTVCCKRDILLFYCILSLNILMLLKRNKV
jgi:hypothetical protein